jgi:hypothetical protein
LEYFWREGREMSSEKKEYNLDRITEMAQIYQRNCYGDISKLHPTQREETQQAYLFGLYEGIQMGKAMPADKADEAIAELRRWIDMRISELLKRMGK